LLESPRPGKFYPDRAKALSVPEGASWKKLQDGEKIEVEGRIVRSLDVSDPPRRGRKLVYSGDTKPSETVLKLAIDADLLIHEATFGDELVDRAAEDGHSTASQAADVASKANVKKLILTHISSRYGDVSPLLAAARVIFPNTVIAMDLLEVEVPHA
jgi:ribonuclease Z